MIINSNIDKFVNYGNDLYALEEIDIPFFEFMASKYEYYNGHKCGYIDYKKSAIIKTDLNNIKEELKQLEIQQKDNNLKYILQDYNVRDLKML